MVRSVLFFLIFIGCKDPEPSVENPQPSKIPIETSLTLPDDFTENYKAYVNEDFSIIIPNAYLNPAENSDQLKQKEIEPTISLYSIQPSSKDGSLYTFKFTGVGEFEIKIVYQFQGDTLINKSNTYETLIFEPQQKEKTISVKIISLATPTKLSPSDGDLNVNNEDVTLKWEMGDTENNYTYDIYLKKSESSFGDNDIEKADYKLIPYKTRTLDPVTKYCWKVKVKVGDRVSEESQSRCFTTGLSSKSKPVIQFPDREAKDIKIENFEFGWQKGENNTGVAGYDLILREKGSKNFQTIQLGIGKTSHKYSDLKKGKTYEYAIIARNRDKGAYLSTDTISFNTEKLDLKVIDLKVKGEESTSENIYDNISLNPDISWNTDGNDKNNTDKYMVYLGEEANDMKLVSNAIYDKEYTFKDLCPDTHYFIRVDIIDENNVQVEGEESIRIKTVNSIDIKPTLNRPSDKSQRIDVEPVFSWIGGKDATDKTEYHLIIGTDYLLLKNSQKLKIENPTNQYQITNTLNHNTAYYWRVEAKNTCGTIQYSDIFSFNTDLPKIKPENLQPTNRSTNIKKGSVFKWEQGEEGDDQTNYKLYISKGSPQFSSENVFYSGKGLKYTLNTNLDLGERYYWRVVATNSKNVSVSSDTLYFTAQTQEEKDDAFNIKLKNKTVSFSGIENDAPTPKVHKTVTERTELIECKTETYRQTASFNENIVHDPSDQLYLGGVYSGKSIQDGSFQPIGVDNRSNITVSIPGLNSKSISDPSLSAIRDAKNEMLSNGKISNGAVVSFEVKEVYNESNVNFALGFSSSFSAFNKIVSGEVGSSFNFNDNTIKSRFIVKFIQVYYTMGMNFQGGASSFFTDVDKVNTDNLEYTPVYISSIKYGRAVYFTFESTKSVDEFKAVLNSSFSIWKKDAKAEISNEHKKVIEETTMKATIVGGNPDLASKVSVNGIEGIKNYISEGGVFDRFTSPGAPLAYTFNSIYDNAIVNNVLATEYPIRTCTTHSKRLKIHVKMLAHKTFSNYTSRLAGDIKLIFGEENENPIEVTLWKKEYSGDHLRLGEGGIQPIDSDQEVIVPYQYVTNGYPNKNVYIQVNVNEVNEDYTHANEYYNDNNKKREIALHKVIEDPQNYPSTNFSTGYPQAYYDHDQKSFSWITYKQGNANHDPLIRIYFSVSIFE